MLPMKLLLALTVALCSLLSLACGSEGGSGEQVATPDLGATVEAAVSAALPTPPPDVDATVAAGVAAGIEATRAAEPTPTPTAPPTIDVDATVEARMAATIAAVPTPTNTPVPKETPIPTPTASPAPTPTPVPTATRRPTSTRRPTATATPTTSPAALLSEMVKQVRPAVVRIDSRVGSGSGAIFETQGRTAYVITNQHVVKGAVEVNVTVNDSATYLGRVLGIDPVRDLAVVRICCGTFQTLEFGDASDLEPGDEVVAIGYALGLTGQASITRGIVSAIRYDSDLLSDVIQTDAAINPGNSGGPMLSLSGEILGINTYRIDEAEPGRVAEGLGFAISEQTVQQRIPALRNARAAPRPTPTRRPRPTPPVTNQTGFGPVDGELRHNPSANIIKTRYANVHASDFIVSANFVNPHSPFTNSWDYGFIVRASGSGTTTRFIEVIVTSDRRWEVLWRQGSNNEGQSVAGGSLSNFDSRGNGENRLWLAAFGSRGVLFVNGEFITTLDLSDVEGAGDIAVITGAFKGNEMRGAATGYADFLVLPLQKRYGPASGALDSERGYIGEHVSGVRTRDLIADAEFARPKDSDWDVGFIIRNPQLDRLEVIGITGNGWWFHNSRDVGDPEYRDLDEGKIAGHPAVLRATNHLLLIAISDFGLLLLNDVLVARMDLSHNLEVGAVSAMGDFFNDHNASPTFRNFNVWTP